MSHYPGRGALFLTFALIVGAAVPAWGGPSRPAFVRIPVATYTSSSAYPTGAGNDAGAYWLTYPTFTVYVPVPTGLPTDIHWRLPLVAAPPHKTEDSALQLRGSLTAMDRLWIRTSVAPVSLKTFRALAAGESSFDRFDMHRLPASDERTFVRFGVEGSFAAGVSARLDVGLGGIGLPLGASTESGNEFTCYSARGRDAVAVVFLPAWRDRRHDVTLSVDGRRFLTAQPSVDQWGNRIAVFAAKLPPTAQTFGLDGPHAHFTITVQACLDD